MNTIPINLDDITPIEDFSNETLLALAQRLEVSHTFQAQLTREVELDEVWRRVDTALKLAQETSPGAIPMLERLFDLVFQAHDLAGEGKALEAANRLRQAMTLNSDPLSL